MELDLTKTYKELTKSFGEGVIISPQELIDSPPKVYSISPCFDLLLGDGIEEGSWVGVSGPPKTGKTTCCALTIAAKAQAKGCPIFYFKMEGRLAMNHLKGIKDLNLNQPHFNIVASSKGNILSGQEYLEIAENIIKNVPNSVLILDSLSSLTHKRELEEGLDAEVRGGCSKLVSQFIRQVKEIVPLNNNIIIGINQVMANVTGYGKSIIDKGSTAFKHQCDYKLVATKGEKWPVDGKNIGIITHWICECSRSAPPGNEGKTYFRFGHGIDEVYEMVEVGTTFGLIDKKGAWYYLSFLEEDEPVKFQGFDKTYNAIQENRHYQLILKEKLCKLLG